MKSSRKHFLVQQAPAIHSGEPYGPIIQIYFSTGWDTYLRSNTPNTNYNSDVGFYTGEQKSATAIYRPLLKFDMSFLPSKAKFLSAILNLKMGAEFSDYATTLGIYRLLRNAVHSQATWNVYSTGNSWQTAGGFGALDCEQSPIATLALSDSEAGGWKEITLPGSTWSSIDLGNGWLLKHETELDNLYTWNGFDSDAANWPKLELQYRNLVSLTSQFSAMGDSKTLDLSPRWPELLINNLNVVEGDCWAKLGFAATSGHTVAAKAAAIDAELAAIGSGDADVVFCNLGSNDVSSLPSESTWKTNYNYILDAIHTKWAHATLYITRPWVRSYLANCNTMAGWIADLVTARSTFCALGDDERVWLEGGDDGATMSTDGMHYSTAGHAEKVNQLKTLLGY